MDFSEIDYVRFNSYLFVTLFPLKPDASSAELILFKLVDLISYTINGVAWFGGDYISYI